MSPPVSAYTHPKPRRLSPAWALCLLLAIAAFFLWEEHRAHILGAVPYVLLLMCPAIHLLMHRGHGAHGHHSPSPDRDRPSERVR